MSPRPFEADPEVGDQPQRDVGRTPGRDRLAVAIPLVIPPGRSPAIVENRVAVEADLHAADDAARRAQQDVLRFVVGGRPAMSRGPALAVVPGADAERVTHDHPAGSGSP